MPIGTSDGKQYEDDFDLAIGRSIPPITQTPSDAGEPTARITVTPKQTPFTDLPLHQGMQEPGNIDLSNRPPVTNPDGTVSTIRSISTGAVAGQPEQGTVLIPTVVDGKVVSNDEAIAHYDQTQQHLGRFDTPENADNYGQLLHHSEALKYLKPTKENPNPYNQYIAPIPVEGAGERIYNKFTGSGGEDRYHTWPERILDHIAESWNRVRDVISGDQKLPSLHGVPGSSTIDDPEARRNLGAVTDVAGYMMFGGGGPAVTLRTADKALGNIERSTPMTMRGGATHIETQSAVPFHEEMSQLAESLRRPNGPRLSDFQRIRAPIHSNEEIESAMRSIEQALGLNAGEAASYARSSGMSSSYPRGWRSVEGGPTLGGFSHKTITFANKDGKKFYVEAADYGGNNIHVGMVGSMTADGYKAGINTDFANTIGVSGMRAVLRKVQEEFPHATSISGFRVTGARPVSGRASVRLKPVAE